LLAILAQKRLESIHRQLMINHPPHSGNGSERRGECHSEAICAKLTRERREQQNPTGACNRREN